MELLGFSLGCSAQRVGNPTITKNTEKKIQQNKRKDCSNLQNIARSRLPRCGPHIPSAHDPTRNQKKATGHTRPIDPQNQFRVRSSSPPSRLSEFVAPDSSHRKGILVIPLPSQLDYAYLPPVEAVSVHNPQHTISLLGPAKTGFLPFKPSVVSFV